MAIVVTANRDSDKRFLSQRMMVLRVYAALSPPSHNGAGLSPSTGSNNGVTFPTSVFDQNDDDFWDDDSSLDMIGNILVVGL